MTLVIVLPFTQTVRRKGDARMQVKPSASVEAALLRESLETVRGCG